jgi:hypothetical protein
MKMTIFSGTERPKLEKEINDWLQQQRMYEIKHITHTNYEDLIFITVWWTK